MREKEREREIQTYITDRKIDKNAQSWIDTEKQRAKNDTRLREKYTQMNKHREILK